MSPTLHKGGAGMVWEFAIVLSVAYTVTIASLGVILWLTRPKTPPTRRFSEIHESAVEVREILLPTAAAAVLGFFVSLAASTVYDNFSPKHDLTLDVGTLNYLLISLVGALLAFAVLAILLEKVRVTARDVTRHPASINRAAGLLLQGKEVADLDAATLKGNLEAWKRQRGKSAAGVMLGRGASPRLNALLQAHDRVLRTEKLPRWFTFRLFVAKAGDFWWTGVVLLVPLLLTSVLVVVASLVDGNGPGRELEAPGRLAISLLCVFVQLLAVLLYLRWDARHFIRVYRIDRIELNAAEKRVAALKRKSDEAVAPRRGLARRLLDALRRP